MKKTRKNAGFTLMEILCALLILVMLIMGINVGMESGSRIYRDATFEADSATLAGILNNSISDILRFSIVTETDGMRNLPPDFDPMDTPFVFTNLEYGVQYAYFYTPVNADGSSSGVLQLKVLKNDETVELVNRGAYPDLVISNFVISYTPRKNPGVEGGYFEVSYDIFSAHDLEKKREVEMIVRLMND